MAPPGVVFNRPDCPYGCGAALPSGLRWTATPCAGCGRPLYPDLPLFPDAMNQGREGMERWPPPGVPRPPVAPPPGSEVWYVVTEQENEERHRILEELVAQRQRGLVGSISHSVFERTLVRRHREASRRIDGMITSDPDPSAGADFSTRALFTLPPGCGLDAVTSDGHGLAFLEEPEGGMQCFWDGIPGEPFVELLEMRDKTPAVFCSQDGAHVAYVGGRGGRIFVGRDGAEDPPCESFSRSVPPVFSRAGLHLAYGAETGGEFRLIVDGQVAGELPIAPIEAVYSPNGERLAFVEMREPADGSAELRIVLDGVPGPWFRGMRNALGAMQFSPDSRRFAYYRIDEEGHSQWVVDGVAQRLANEVRSIGLAQIRGIGVLEPPLIACFSPDSRRFAYFADVVEKGVAILEDDVPGPLFKAVGMPVFSPDSRRLAYLAQTYEKKLTLVVDGVAGPERAGTWGGTPVFSGDSRHVALTIHREEGNILRKRRLVSLAVDGRIVAEVDGDDASLEPVFSPDGERVAWWVGRGKIRDIMVNETPHTDGAVAYSDPVFTSTGRLVYAAIVVPDGKVTILVDGRPGPLADVVADPRSTIAVFESPRTGRPTRPFEISPDGEHVAWAGAFGEEWRPVLDDRVGPSFDQVFTWAFEEDGTAVWWAQRADAVYRVAAQPD